MAIQLATRASPKCCGRYAQYHNSRRVRSGHLWQNPFYSCAMEGSHLWNAIRYVELNPARAGLVGSPA